MEQLAIVNILLIVILAVVLVLPFNIKVIEKNLEMFLFLCGVTAMSVASFAASDGEIFGWTPAVILEALAAPIMITTIFGIPVGIVQIVLIMGLIIFFPTRRFTQ